MFVMPSKAAGKIFYKTCIVNGMKATDPLIHAKGTMTLLLQLGRKANVHSPTRDPVGKLSIWAHFSTRSIRSREGSKGGRGWTSGFTQVGRAGYSPRKV